MKKISVLYISLALVLSGCSSSEQMSGVFTGGMLGGIFGSSIGGLMDGPRGHDAGNLIGMVVGGTLGAAVTAPKTMSATRHRDIEQRDIKICRMPPRSACKTTTTT